jgi:hypothetical protein
MTYNALIDKIVQLEYHQNLLLIMLSDTKLQFFKLVIEKSLREADVDAFFKLCDQLSNDLKEQKAEGFVHFNPLFEKFKVNLHPNLQAEDVIRSCLAQQLFTPLMTEFKKYI